ncbi:hypothetical protein [Eggerthia catenaformis]|uniref:hypothetical protein n=1 Tax=Eggerthia catenaformis TaxID=31973 RepID=UPI00248EE026|nr:hypothetical protein [Eggerthia catenaformis]
MTIDLKKCQPGIINNTSFFTYMGVAILINLFFVVLGHTGESILIFLIIISAIKAIISEVLKKGFPKIILENEKTVADVLLDYDHIISISTYDQDHIFKITCVAKNGNIDTFTFLNFYDYDDYANTNSYQNVRYYVKENIKVDSIYFQHNENGLLFVVPYQDNRRLTK